MDPNRSIGIAGRVEKKVFRGLYEHTIDANGRTSIPARFREALARPGKKGKGRAKQRGNGLIITTGIDPCLVAYPLAEWTEFERRLAGLSQFDPAVVQLKRIYVSGATECTIDKHGRLMIPPLLREYAGFGRDLVWAGMVTFIEIWDKEAWTELSASSRVNRDEIARALTELGL